VSGTGIHVLVRGELPPGRRMRDGFEMYSDRRFFVVTGRHVAGTPKRIERRQAETEAVHAAIFGSGLARKHETSVPKSVTQFAPITQVRGVLRNHVNGQGLVLTIPSADSFFATASLPVTTTAAPIRGIRQKRTSRSAAN